jgi:hypothetical protein
MLLDETVLDDESGDFVSRQERSNVCGRDKWTFMKLIANQTNMEVIQE